MNKNTILICDDDDGIVDVTKMVLEDKGYIVEICLDTTQIFEIIKKISPSLIFLDLWMPGIGGERLTKQLKKNSKTNTIPIIIMSANKDTEKIAKKVGADGFLCKPFDIFDLEAIAKKYTHI